MLENASLLARLVLQAIPSSKAFYLSNRQVSATLKNTLGLLDLTDTLSDDYLMIYEVSEM
jgi:hypothetical protein